MPPGSGCGGIEEEHRRSRTRPTNASGGGYPCRPVLHPPRVALRGGED